MKNSEASQASNNQKFGGKLAERSLLLIVKLLSCLPYSIRSALGLALGYLAGLLPIRERRFASLQLRAFLPEAPWRTITPRVFSNVGQTLLESLNVKPILKRASKHITCENWDEVKGWVSDSRPLITLTGHTGNWDLLAAWVISRGIPLTTIGREARSPSAQALLKKIREDYGIETIWRSDRAGLKRLISCLNERRVLAALIDQDTRVDSIAVPFFGSPAKTPVSLITLGQKMNARFVTAFIFRTGWLRYSVFASEIPDQENEEKVLEIYNQQLESLIRKYPSQWVWFHKRWRSPDGKNTLSSKEYERSLLSRAGALCALISPLISLIFSACASSHLAGSIEEAESLSEQGRYEDAIKSYREHIDQRSLASRPDWENPYFYLIRISELELELGQPDEALKACTEAEQQGVDPRLISDRYRAIASWHIERGESQQAFEILKQNRARDPLLFDALLDRVARDMARKGI